MASNFFPCSLCLQRSKVSPSAISDAQASASVIPRRPMPRLQEVLPIPCHQERQFVGLADGDLSLAVDGAALRRLGQKGGHGLAVGPHGFEGVLVLRVQIASPPSLSDGPQEPLRACDIAVSGFQGPGLPRERNANLRACEGLMRKFGSNPFVGPPEVAFAQPDGRA